MTGSHRFAGSIATGAGQTRVELALGGSVAEVTVAARWMGDREPLAVTLICRHHAVGARTGALVLERAVRAGAAGEIPLPPSDGAIVLEYAQVGERSADPFALLLWLDREAAIDDGTDLGPDDYAVPPASFRPVVDALDWLVRPWKLEPAREVDRAGSAGARTHAALRFVRASADHLPVLDPIRQAAFAPVFASFRSLLGDEVYEIAQRREDDRQGELLASLVRADSGWELYAVEREPVCVGFIALRLDPESKVGEIGLNAVHPDHAGHGVGTAMYEFALSRMTEAGMRVATVATGGDASHAPARRAYRKAGFDLEIPSVWMCRRLD